jgi:hypothetical protein
VLQNIHESLNHYLITTQTIYSSGGLPIYYCVICHETGHHSQAQVTFGTVINHALALAVSWTKMAAEFAGFCWSVFVTAAVELHNICCGLTWPSNQYGGGSILAYSSFFDHIPHKGKSEISLVYLGPHEGNRIQELSAVRSRRWKNISIHL